MFHGLKRPILLLGISLCLVIQTKVKAAEEDVDLNAIEAEMSRRGEEQALQSSPSEREQRAEASKPLTFQELPRLSPFSEVSVIQKKFMPKTNRFQLYGGVDFLTNNPFFDTYGFNGRFAFFFSEFIGVELNFWRHSVSPRTITTDLESKHGITTKTMLSSLGYFGGSLIFVPFYGKMTFIDKRIIPYDLYVSVGAGQTETSYLDKSAPSIHIGTGEIFALSKSFAWRWDFSNIMYTARAPDVTADSKSLVDTGKKRSISDLYLGIGLTILFPGARYR